MKMCTDEPGKDTSRTVTTAEPRLSGALVARTPPVPEPAQWMAQALPIARACTNAKHVRTRADQRGWEGERHRRTSPRAVDSKSASRWRSFSAVVKENERAQRMEFAIFRAACKMARGCSVSEAFASSIRDLVLATLRVFWRVCMRAFECVCECVRAYDLRKAAGEDRHDRCAAAAEQELLHRAAARSGARRT